MGTLDALERSFWVKYILRLLVLGTYHDVLLGWLVLLHLVWGLLSFTHIFKDLLDTPGVTSVAALHSHHWIVDLELQSAQLAALFLRVESQLRLRQCWGELWNWLGHSVMDSFQAIIVDSSPATRLESLVEESLLTHFEQTIKLSRVITNSWGWSS